MGKVRIIEAADKASVASWLAGYLAPRLLVEPVVISVPGGSSPFPILIELAKLDLNFSRLTVWPGDDRIVPEDHPASNVGRIRPILEPLGVCIVTLVEGQVPPPFALTWLGMGEDGHIASLFPNTNPNPHDQMKLRRLSPDPLPPEAPFDRLTLTIPALVGCEQLMFVVRGEGKRSLFQAAARGENDLPVARLLLATAAPVTCFVLP